MAWATIGKPFWFRYTVRPFVCCTSGEDVSLAVNPAYAGRQTAARTGFPSQSPPIHGPVSSSEKLSGGRSGMAGASSTF